MRLSAITGQPSMARIGPIGYELSGDPTLENLRGMACVPEDDFYRYLDEPPAGVAVARVSNATDLTYPTISSERFAGSSPLASPIPRLLPHQGKIVDDIKNSGAPGQPWQGVIAPMQTGKSAAIPHVVKRISRHYDAVIVLTFSRFATRQVFDDHQKVFPDEEIGRVDEHHKSFGKITVASAWTLIHHLDRLDPQKKYLVIMDEAYPLQSQTARTILTHLNLAQPHEGKKKRVIPNPHTRSRLIAFSGTAAGLDKNCEIISRLGMLDALERNLIRLTKGKRVFPKDKKDADYDKVRVADHEEIWWKNTDKNAHDLALEYREHISGQYQRNLIFAPTIEHGKLLIKHLRETCPDENFALLHSEMTEAEQQEAYKIYEAGGSLISVRMLARSFRGGMTGAIFHTFQTSSAEFFAQTTGRGWANPFQEDLPELFVLEACWDRRPVFSNLARLYGLVDYPEHDFDPRGIARLVRKKQEVDADQESIAEEIRLGKVHAFFGQVPMVRTWRDTFREFLAAVQKAYPNEDPIEVLAARSPIDVQWLNGFAQGGLPVRMLDLTAIYHGMYTPMHVGQQKIVPVDFAVARLADAWFLGWREAVHDLSTGVRHTDAIPTDIKTFFAAQSSDEISFAQLRALDKILALHFKVPRPKADYSEIIARLEPHTANLVSLWNTIKSELAADEASNKTDLKCWRVDFEVNLVLTLSIRRSLEETLFKRSDDWTGAHLYLTQFCLNKLHAATDVAAQKQWQDHLDQLDRAAFTKAGWAFEHDADPENILRHLLRKARARTLDGPKIQSKLSLRSPFYRWLSSKTTNEFLNGATGAWGKNWARDFESFLPLFLESVQLSIPDNLSFYFFKQHRQAAEFAVNHDDDETNSQLKTIICEMIYPYTLAEYNKLHGHFMTEPELQHLQLWFSGDNTHYQTVLGIMCTQLVYLMHPSLIYRHHATLVAINGNPLLDEAGSAQASSARITTGRIRGNPYFILLLELREEMHRLYPDNDYKSHLQGHPNLLQFISTGRLNPENICPVMDELRFFSESHQTWTSRCKSYGKKIGTPKEEYGFKNLAIAAAAYMKFGWLVLGGDSSLLTAARKRYIELTWGERPLHEVHPRFTPEAAYGLLTQLKSNKRLAQNDLVTALTHTQL